MFKNSDLGILFNLRDEKAKGRLIMLASAMLTGAISWLTTGLFYTSFLTENGIDLVKIGIISFVPFIASCFSIFAPSILERIPKRRWVLCGVRFTYYTLNILGITVMPRLVHGEGARLTLFVVIIFAANIINSMFSSGFTAWQINFIPEDVRAGYFSVSAIGSGVVGLSTGLISAIIADSFRSSPHAYTIIVVLRYAAYALAVLDCWLLSRPKEYPYKHSATRVRLTDIIRRPFSTPKFIYTMVIIALWAFFSNTAVASRNYYLLNTINMSYTYYMLTNFTYIFFQIAMVKFAQRIINRYGWLKTFAYSVLISVGPTLACSFVNKANYLWLYSLVRLTQHLTGMTQNTAYSNILYLNMPEEDRTNYIAFYTLTANIFSMLGTLFGTMFVGIFPDLQLALPGITLCNVQVLMWVETFGLILVPVLILTNLKRLSPDPAEAK